MQLLDDAALEQSGVVANCRMNRERNLLGSNGYSAEIRFNPLDFLIERAAVSGRARWLDLCCGTGKALLEVAVVVDREQRPINILGVDLVGMFAPSDSRPVCLRLVQAALSTWEPDQRFDLITCIHGLHYIGDKLGLITRAAAWLTDEGRFVANLDLRNIKLRDGRSAGRVLATKLRRKGFSYDSRRKLIHCEGWRLVTLPFAYLGADDQAGPNCTGQSAVDSYYDQTCR